MTASLEKHVEALRACAIVLFSNNNSLMYSMLTRLCCQLNRSGSIVCGVCASVIVHFNLCILAVSQKSANIL